MAKDPSDIAGEIEKLRQESDVIVDELLHRAALPNLARGVTSTMTDTASSMVNEAASVVSDAASNVSHMVDEMPEPVRQHPFAAAFTSVGLLAGVTGFALSWFTTARQPTASERAAYRLRTSAAQGVAGVQGWLRRTEGIRGDVRAATERGEPSMVKRLLWVGIASVMATLGSMLFKRMTATAWRSTMHEEPPK